MDVDRLKHDASTVSATSPMVTFLASRSQGDRGRFDKMPAGATRSLLHEPPVAITEGHRREFTETVWSRRPLTKNEFG